MAKSKKPTRRFMRMRVSDGFKAFVLDQLEDVGEVTARSMFGGIGLYRGGVFFGIIAADTLYLKVNDDNRPDFEHAGSKPFKPYAHRPASRHYWAVPLE